MLDRLESIVRDGGALFRAEGEILLAMLRRSLLISSVILAAGVLVLIALAGLAVAAAAALAAEIGWVWALVLMSTCLLTAGTATIAMSQRWLHKALQRSAMPTGPRRRAAIASGNLREEIGMDTDDQKTSHTNGSSTAPPQNKSWQETAAEFVAENPGAVLGGLFAAVSLVGPVRSVRLLSRGMMLAGLASTVLKEVSEKAAEHAAAEAAGPTAGPKPAPVDPPVSASV